MNILKPVIISAVYTLKKNDILLLKDMESALFSSSWSLKQYTQAIESSHFLVYGINVNQTLAGYVTAYHLIDELEIVNIGVLPAFQRLHLATELFKTVLTVAAKKGIIKILLEVREHNAPARSFYKKFGFIQDGIRKKYYSDTGEDALLLSLTF